MPSPLLTMIKSRTPAKVPGITVSPAAKQTGSADHDRGHGLKFHSPSSKSGDLAQVHRREKTAYGSADA